MTGLLPELYFRVRENGAAVFRVDGANRNRRIEMTQVALVNVRNGEVRPTGDKTLSDAETVAIGTWLENRKAQLKAREIDDIKRVIEHLNLTAAWAQSRATDAELQAVTDDLLMAMHDLRSVLVRKSADRLKAADRSATD